MHQLHIFRFLTIWNQHSAKYFYELRRMYWMTMIYTCSDVKLKILGKVCDPYITHHIYILNVLGISFEISHYLYCGSPLLRNMKRIFILLLLRVRNLRVRFWYLVFTHRWDNFVTRCLVCIALLIMGCVTWIQNINYRNIVCFSFIFSNLVITKLTYLLM